MTIGILHPGNMGAALGSAVAEGVVWASEGRSAATRSRAEGADFEDVGTVVELSRRSDVIISVCPPGAAVDIARTIVATSFSGIYVDANAVSPATSIGVASMFKRFVDGGIVGPPPLRSGTTRLYLSGDDAATVADLFTGSTLEAVVLEGGAGTASALKMCFASWTKGSAALLLAVRALADSTGVSAALDAEWSRSFPDLVRRSESTAAGVGPKAWRFEGEMGEIAATYAAGGLPDGFARAAAEVYSRMAPLKDSPAPSLEDVMELLTAEPDVAEPS